MANRAAKRAKPSATYTRQVRRSKMDPGRQAFFGTSADEFAEQLSA